jgi:chemotaxis protein CheZ
MAGVNNEQQEVFEQIGHMTRTLHKTLLDLGDESTLERTVESIPDTRERLAYVLSMTEQAVSRVLNAVDAITPLQEDTQDQARQLLTDWERVADKRRDAKEYQETLQRTQAFLQMQEERATVTKERLMEIVMAQEFQDLTGQVIKKIVELASTMETQLLALLDRTTPVGRKKPASDSLLNGPAMQSDVAEKHVLNSQQEVDKFLDDLGF